jgi:hypothetical protein
MWPALGWSRGEEFHHNRLSLIASIDAWGRRHAPARPAVEPAAGDGHRHPAALHRRVSIDGLLARRFPYEQAPAAYRWIDEHPQDAVKVALTY